MFDRTIGSAELFSEVRPNSSVRFGSAGDKMFGRHRTYFHQRKGKYQAIYRQIKTLGKKVFCRNSFARCSEYLENYSYWVLYRFVSLGLHFNTIRFQWKKFGVRFGSAEQFFFGRTVRFGRTWKSSVRSNTTLKHLICTQYRSVTEHNAQLRSALSFALSALICTQRSNLHSSI